VKQLSFLPGVNVGDKVNFHGRTHTVRKIYYCDPCMTGKPEKYCDCVDDRYGGVYGLDEKTVLEYQRRGERGYEDA
jgi:hypothetical protein